MSNRKQEITKAIDWPLLWLWLLLCSIGILAIFAVTYKDGDSIIQALVGFKTDYSKQFYFFGLSFIIGVFILLTDSKFFTATATIWYLLGIIMLLLVFPFGSNVRGTESIIRIGGFQFQPAEFCKICVCLALAKYLSQPQRDLGRTKTQLVAASIVLLPAIIIVMQSETGLALVYFSFFIVMYREGLSSIILIVGISVAIMVVATLLIEKNTLFYFLTFIALVIIYFLRHQVKKKISLLFFVLFIWLLCVSIQRFAVPFFFKQVLKPHQVERIFSTIGKDVPVEYSLDGTVTAKNKDVHYNVKQSKIAIGSGGFFGKGLLKGTQTRYDFVPEQRTDFIFCAIGEGFGFMGSFVLIGLYVLLLFRIILLAERQRSTFSRGYAYGVAAVFFFHIIINITMTVGLAPVIGIPLPFLSYGGTSLLTNSILLFILARLDADRQMVMR